MFPSSLFHWPIHDALAQRIPAARHVSTSVGYEQSRTVATQSPTVSDGEVGQYERTSLDRQAYNDDKQHQVYAQEEGSDHSHEQAPLKGTGPRV